MFLTEQSTRLQLWQVFRLLCFLKDLGYGWKYQLLSPGNRSTVALSMAIRKFHKLGERSNGVVGRLLRPTLESGLSTRALRGEFEL